MVSIPRLSLGKLGGTPGGTPPRDNSPLSPKSWEDSLLELDSGLQRICGSPSPATSQLSLYKYSASPTSTSTSSPPLDVTAPAMVSPDSDATPRLRSSSCRRALSQETPSRPTSLPQEAAQTPHSHYLLRSHSCAPATASGTAAARPLMVRHEETPKKLAEKLSRICGPGQLNQSLNIRIPTPPQSKDVMALNTSVFRRESLKNGFKHKVDITGIKIADLTVMVTENHGLCVKHMTSPEGTILAEVALPHSIRLRHLMCYVFRDDLFIRERSKPLWSCQNHHSGPLFLPVVEEGEYTNDLRVVIRVPDMIRYEDLSVKTVDDCLIISRKRTSFPGTVMAMYEVTLMLPDMGDSRGVEASLYRGNQLFIIVSFDSRRYTC